MTTTYLPYNTIRVEYRPFQMDVHTVVTVRDHFGKYSESSFEYDEQADEYIASLPSDYSKLDYRQRD